MQVGQAMSEMPALGLGVGARTARMGTGQDQIGPRGFLEPAARTGK
jgi:hypothetical protein